VPYKYQNNNDYGYYIEIVLKVGGVRKDHLVHLFFLQLRDTIDVFLIELLEYYRNCLKGCRDYKAW
jgi:hypothetical protein